MKTRQDKTTQKVKCKCGREIEIDMEECWKTAVDFILNEVRMKKNG